MRNVNIAADGGGTSLRILAFDDDLRLVARSVSGPVNPNFERLEKIKANMAEAAGLLKTNLGAAGFKINKIYATIVGPADLFGEIFMGVFGEYAAGAAFEVISEARSHLFAASLGNKGGVALAGTGSGAIYCGETEIIHLGGYGVPVGDEGSGAWIGIQGMSAAIKYKAGWGEPTILLDKLYEYLNIGSSDYIAGKLYGKDINQRNLFAGFCKCVAECEKAGDKIARDIIYTAGKYMGLQMVAAIKKAAEKNIIGANEAPVIYASGGVWKGTPYMLEAMNEIIRGVYPGAVCKYGAFDPVIAGVIKFIFDKTGGYGVPDGYKARLTKEFEDYEVKIK